MEEKYFKTFEVNIKSIILFTLNSFIYTLLDYNNK